MSASYASVAGKLASAVAIGGASFDGSTAITLSQMGAAAATHTHSTGDVTGLSSALDGKANSTHTHSTGDVTGLQSALDSMLKVVASLPSASSDVVGKCYLNLADSHIYTGEAAASPTGTLVPKFTGMDYTIDGIDNQQFLYSSGSGDGRKWETVQLGAWQYAITFQSTAWKIGSDANGSYYATASSGSNPWDSGLEWHWYGYVNGGTSQADVTCTGAYVQADMGYALTQIM